jgi:hypothetical protein
VQHVAPVAAPVGLLFEEIHALQGFVLERELERRPHVRLEPLEQREGLVEQLPHASEAVGGRRLEAPHGRQALRDHRADQLAPAGETAVGRGA